MSIINALANKGINAKEVTVTKNGVEVKGVCIDNGTEAHPVLYYENYETEEDMVQDCIRAMETKFDYNIGIITNYETAKDKLRLALTQNPNANELAEIAFCDLYKTAYLDLNDSSITRVTTSLAKQWGVSTKEIFKTALENMSYIMMGMSEMMFGVPMEDEPFKVVTTENKHMGASAILKAKLPDKCYMLPSSVHEVLVVTEEPQNPHDMTVMVQEVNRTQVAPEERLADHAYYYENGTWTIVD